jgi:hypothetical protein
MFRMQWSSIPRSARSLIIMMMHSNTFCIQYKPYAVVFIMSMRPIGRRTAVVGYREVIQVTYLPRQVEVRVDSIEHLVSEVEVLV